MKTLMKIAVHRLAALVIASPLVAALVAGVAHASSSPLPPLPPLPPITALPTMSDPVLMSTGDTPVIVGGLKLPTGATATETKTPEGSGMRWKLRLSWQAASCEGTCLRVELDRTLGTTTVRLDRVVALGPDTERVVLEESRTPDGRVARLVFFPHGMRSLLAEDIPFPLPGKP